jgi:hypothetical protein
MHTHEEVRSGGIGRIGFDEPRMNEKALHVLVGEKVHLDLAVPRSAGVNVRTKRARTELERNWGSSVLAPRGNNTGQEKGAGTDGAPS